MSKFGLCMKWLSYLFILIFLFILCVLIGVRYVFGEDGNFSIVIAHLSLVKSYPLTPYIKEIVLGIISFICLSYVALRYWKIAIVFCLLTITAILGKWHFFYKDSSIFSQEYLTPQAYFPKDLPKKNIIIISLESFEDIFAIDDITKSGNLIPNLSLLKEEGVTFDGYEDMGAMRPTIPSFFAKNCGIPSRTREMNLYNYWAVRTDYTQFPNAKCVFDILRDNGYRTYYIDGGNLADEGAASFLDAHPVDLALGNIELLKNGASQLKSKYLIPDSELYKYAQKILSGLQGQPFGLHIITGNTHGAQKGGYYVENGCENAFGDFRDAIQCLDKVTYDFIKWCQIQSWYKDTVIYLIGDHLMRPSELRVFADEAEKYPRQVFTLMLNGNSVATKVINRKYTQADFAPTFLESLGFVSPALGIGRSLFREDATLVEKLGKKELETEIQNSQMDFQNIIHGKTFSSDTKEPSNARIDILTPLVDAEKTQFDVYVDASKIPEQQSSWMPRNGSQGYVIHGYGNKMDVKININNNIDLEFLLRGVDKRNNKNEVIENWVQYTSVTIDGKEILKKPVEVWHNKPFKYKISAKKNDVIKLHAEWNKYKPQIEEKQ